MKKILFTLVALFGCATMSIAQTSFIATLSHEGQFTHYYGAGALTMAYDAAADGDIVTLSPGTFTFSGKFEKGITLRGAAAEGSATTTISGEVNFYSTDSKRVTVVEGIRFSGDVHVFNDASGTGQGTIKFIKDIFASVQAYIASSYSTDAGPAVRFYNCALYAFYFNANTYPDYLFYNCYVENPYSSGTNFSDNISAFVNCVIRWTTYWSELTHYLNFYNCIFNWTYNGYGGSSSAYLLPNTTTCYNCLSINKSKLFDNLVSGGNNYKASNASDVFTSYRDGHIAGETFALTEEAKAAYIGTDGKEIGMQGGYYPYNTTLQYPVITKFNPDPQTNKAGMLNVEVEVDGK